MFKNLILGIAAVLVVAGCSSKKKAEDAPPDAGAAQTQPDTAIATDKLTFDPAGSDSGSIPGLSSINFDYDKANISGKAKQILGENAEWIKSHGTVNLQIEGHSDNRGSIEYNLALGERRAKSVKNYLVSLGIPAARLSVISYGEEKPLDSGENESSWAKNRRANFVPLSQ